ncbi:N-acetyltransferase [Hippea alviniae]|uniref:N-acetyltransferase n=1 Tax=Hippea alviniae TaxID=1279027 RepID=UPI0003B4096A|nr:N-acetyltransferase [Hippea alviniae]
MSDINIVKPTLNDVDDIYKLVSYFAKKGDILARSKENIAERIREFQCAKGNGNVIGISSLRIFYPHLAEIRSIAIDENYQNMGIGKMLVSACIEEAKRLGVKNVFALTFKKEFFLKLGFKPIDKKELPSNKIWEDCINCPLFPNCKEEAVIYSLY